jgi:uncharacterized membrane protein
MILRHFYVLHLVNICTVRLAIDNCVSTWKLIYKNIHSLLLAMLLKPLLEVVFVGLVCHWVIHMHHDSQLIGHAQAFNRNVPMV